MAVTQEWTQRTALVTFTQVPARLILVAAKFVASLLVAALAVVVGLTLAVAANVMYGALSGSDVVWGVGVDDLGRYFLLHAIGMASGFAFGTLFLNTAVAIVVFFVYKFVLPLLIALGAFWVEWIAKAQPWIDFGSAQTPLTTGGLTSDQWAHLVVSGLLWLVLPVAIGVWRVLRAEVK
jgi:hypothetical protein